MTDTKPYNIADHLRTPEEMAEYLIACVQEGADDAAFLRKAVGDVVAAATKLRAPVADERISLRGAANLAFNALHECKPTKGAEKQYSDAIQALQSALHDIAYTVNRTATPQQFADHLQREARAALASAPVAGEPFMYGIMGPDGKAHFEEFCVSGDRAELQAEVVDHLNRDNPEDGSYSVVALFRDAAPQASAEYERGHADGWAAGWDQAIKQPQADKDGGTNG